MTNTTPLPEVEIMFRSPDELYAYQNAPLCLRELIFNQAREIAALTANHAAQPEQIHSCGPYCERPACVLDQRNKMRDSGMDVARLIHP